MYNLFYINILIENVGIKKMYMKNVLYNFKIQYKNLFSQYIIFIYFYILYYK